MTEAFDPFEETDVCPESSFLSTTTTSSNQSQSRSRSNSALNTSHESQVNNTSSTSGSILKFQSQFGASFDSNSDPTRKVAALNRSINSSIDSDIFSQLFKIDGSGGRVEDYMNDSSFNSSFSSSSSIQQSQSKSTSVSPFASPQSTPKILTTNTRINLPVYVTLHETMSCVYDGPAHPPVFAIDGEINLIPNKFIQGQSFYIALKDPKNHIGEVTTYFDCARELSKSSCNETDAFVQKKFKENCRVYKIYIPENLMHMKTKPIRVMKFSGSEFLRPIPLLVHCKVKVGGNLCRVGVKVRANPTNTKNINNIAILMAVPPDVSGETMKISLRGGVWDPMRRLIIWSAPSMKNGQTIEYQLQFEYMPINANVLPAFPILVRCDADNQLSNVEIEVGGETYYDANGDLYRQSEDTPYKMNLSKTYRLFHRKT